MSTFVDKTDIFIKAGKGGNGAVSFRREKYVAKGGPDGGDGGHGGNVVFCVDPGENTLVRFRYKRKYIAENGEEPKIEELANAHSTRVLGKLPIDPELASVSDRGVVELFEGDYLESCADYIENKLPV